MIRNADQALQRAKATGPGVLQVFNRDMRVTANRALALRTRLRRAVDRGEIIPYFQPQVDLTTGEVVGMEALARWIDPENGIIPPNDFIPIAEESGLIEGLCESILRNCARQNKAWQDQGLPVVPVAVNVSGRQFQVWRRLLASLESVLRETGLNPALMEIELTESSAMHDAETAIKVLRQIGEMGMACSIDDFGTGYSSLSVLKRFPVSKLKIDRSFVLDVLTDPNDAAIVGAIIAMARALGLTTIAEGVEDHAHATFLRGLGCQQMQGYLFARPLPADDMGRLLAEGRRLDLPA